MITGATGQKGNIASNYFVLIDELSARNVSQNSKTEVQASPVLPVNDPFFTFAPYGVAGIAIVLFIIAFGIQLNKSIHKSRQMMMAIIIAVFAACIPSVLTYVNQGTRQDTHAGPEYTPRNVRVVKIKPASIAIDWVTDVPVYTMIRLGPAPLGGALARLYRDTAEIKTTEHSVTVDGLKYAIPYEFEIYSGNIWYDNAGEYIQFTLK